MSVFEALMFAVAFAALVIFIIMGILWIIYYPKCFYSLIARQSKKMLKEGKNDGLLGERYMILSDEGIIDSSSNGETKVKWAGIKKLEEDNDYFYFYNSSVSAYILPKRMLMNVEKTRDYLNSKLMVERFEF